MCNCGRVFSIIVFLSVIASQAGVLQRFPNTSIAVPVAPAVYGYTLETVPLTSFSAPIAIASAPGETKRVFVVLQAGKIMVTTNFGVSTASVFLDITAKVTSGGELGLLSMAFHPGYATNGYFYLFYTLNDGVNGLSDRLARFKVSDADPNKADPSSEVTLITQKDDYSNHNGGDLHFGPDGYLYISLGDEGDQNDTGNNSQRIDKDFFSGILRIDVGKKSTSLPPNQHPSSSTNYAVPSDNPFVGATQFNGLAVDPSKVRTEFWAVGLRNPWRFSFDSRTGTLYCGDVGQNTREEVDVIVKGGNYGWAFREASIAGPKNGQAPAGFVSIPPIAEYTHGSGPLQGNAVIGGVVYRGNRISQLTGRYVFADNGTGNIWMLTPNGTNAVAFERIASQPGIAAFGVDPANGDILIADQANRVIKRLVYDNKPIGTPFSQALSDTGVFTDLSQLTPNPGIVPYNINVPFWSDGAFKERWFSLPNTNQTITFARDANWQFPTGTVWIKHFELELTNGIPESRRRLETRLLVRSTNGVYGITYRWGNSLTNATLVPEEGLDETFEVHDGDTVRQQVWHYPTRNECLRCHTAVAGYALGFNTPQLNRDMDYPGGTTNQIVALREAGYFTNPEAVTNTHTLRWLADANNNAISREYRVRSYLAANCVQCHQPGGVSGILFDTRITTPTSLAGLIDGPLANSGAGGNSLDRVIAPGDEVHSVLFQRIANLNAAHMPPISTTVLDTNDIALVRAWISDLAGYESFTKWQTRVFGSTNAPAALAGADPDQDGLSNYGEYLLGSDPNQMSNIGDLRILPTSNDIVRLSFDRIANRSFQVEATEDLGSSLWQALDLPSNRPFYSVTNAPAQVDDATISTNRFYRLRIYEP
ncbi:MAG: hypothetical protein JWM99_2600 [Verrucomicrobiales bacterium]|nr:hypothetical protein [Verrucomicrobiales bacterium]